MRIAISGALEPRGFSGGGEQFFMGLVYSLGAFDSDSGREYLVLPGPTGGGWLSPYVGANTRLVQPPLSAVQIGRAMLGPFRRPVGEAIRRLRKRRVEGTPELRCDQSIESLDPDVVHFPIQAYARCSRPTVYNPHDLQHRHYPEFFDPAERMHRDHILSTGCREATLVVTESEWVRQDILDQYAVSPDRVHVIYWGAPTDLYPAVPVDVRSSVTKRLKLPREFIFYPAQTWPHKNHLRLLEAVARLKRDGFDLHLVCTGRKNQFWPRIARRIEELGLTSNISFPGFISALELKAVYQLAHAVVFPSLFEGGGFPVLEALAEGKPLACSRVCGLHEYAGDSAVYFDPLSVDAIVDAVQGVVTDSSLRAELTRKAKVQAGHFSWEKMAREYVQTYETAALSR